MHLTNTKTWRKRFYLLGGLLLSLLAGCGTSELDNTSPHKSDTDRSTTWSSDQSPDPSARTSTNDPSDSPAKNGMTPPTNFYDLPLAVIPPLKHPKKSIPDQQLRERTATALLANEGDMLVRPNVVLQGISDLLDDDQLIDAILVSRRYTDQLKELRRQRALVLENAGSESGSPKAELRKIRIKILDLISQAKTKLLSDVLTEEQRRIFEQRYPSSKIIEKVEPPQDQLDPDPTSLTAAPTLTIINQLCSKCHRGTEAEGDFRLSELRDTTKASSQARWQQVVEAIDDQYMPPADHPQPNEQQKEIIRTWATTHAAARRVKPAVRRMNHTEYENTIRDLLQTGRDAFSSPTHILKLDEYFDPASGKMPRYVFAVSHFAYSDRSRPELLDVSTPPIDKAAEHGYANDAESLKFSPLLLEKYLQLGNEIVHSSTLQVVSRQWQELFVPPPQQADQVLAEARNRLAKFLTRAFRRPVRTTELDAFTKLFESHWAVEKDFTKSMRNVAAAVLASPEFLFLFQPSDQSLTRAQRRSYENASRLSYFLWASMPDDRLLEIAAQGKLVAPRQLREQTQRMLRDKKAKSLATDFGMQWLKVNRLNTSQPDLDKYKSFFGRKIQPIGVSMMIEQLLLFETILVENRSILDFIDADFMYLNHDLLFWYRLNHQQHLGFMPENESFSDFYRVQLPTPHVRGGVITSGATLVLTSTSTRTSPVFRGAWLAETIFNRPPPPPPPNVPALEDVKSTDTTKLSIRQRLKLHRKDPNCASCHAKIDPLGFALESFDPVGQTRRTYDDGTPIDTATTYNGNPIPNAYGLKKHILRNPQTFVKAFVEHMLRYALNRKLVLADGPDVNRITQAVIADDYRLRTVIEQIVISDAFRAGEKMFPNSHNQDPQPAQ